MNLQNLSANWKTSSAGIVLIMTGLIHLVFGLIHKNITEQDFTTTMVSIITGVGLIVAGDASKSVANHDETLKELDNIKSAMRSGDTSIITKPVDPAQPKP
jgi:hypothetical protein